MKVFNLFSISDNFMIDANYLQKLSAVTSFDEKMLEVVAPKRSDRFKNQFSGIRDGVAVIDIYGVIFRYDNLLTQWGYGTSIDSIIKDLNTALQSSDICAIILRIDSPGGEVAGVSDLADFIYSIRGVKKITAYAESLMASAAYFIGSAAGEVVVGDMAQVGSIGVVTTVSKSENGKTFEIVSSNAKNKRLDVASEQGLLKIQQRIDRLADIFVDKVSTYRSLTATEVIAAGDSGGVRIGDDAVKSKLADRVLKFEELFMNIKNIGGVHNMLDPIKPAASENAAHQAEITPENRSTSQTTADAVKAERERMLALDRLSISGAESIVAEAKESGASVETTAVKIVQFLKSNTHDTAVTKKETQSLNVAPIDQESVANENTRAKDLALAEAAAKQHNRRK